MGHQAYRFIEFLNSCGFKVWQMLPLGPTHEDKSPYQCTSSHAGNPLLISLDWLEDKGWLNRDEVDDTVNTDVYRRNCLKKACSAFHKKNDKYWMDKLNEFVEKHKYWIDDFALFMALRKKHQNKPWFEWPEDVRHREAQSLVEAKQELKESIDQIIFQQFVFFTQWFEIRDYAKKFEVELFGDIPIFVSHDSADVWAQRECFLMSADGEMSVVAGVPPDAFSDVGQRWGNPLYDWKYMQSNGFAWWKERFKTQLELFDLLRIDHFRGLQACWEIPATEETAINGSWVEVPGKELLDELFETFNDLPLIAEDLGVITDEVIKLKDSFDLPGMKVLQFAFDGNSANPHLPHMHRKGDVVYTGTHDNDTTLGWAQNPLNYNKEYLAEYSGQNNSDDKETVMQLIRMALSSVSFLSVLPLQDVLMLDSSARMNVPGTTTDNWLWRFDWKQLKPDLNAQFTRLLKVYQR